MATKAATKPAAKSTSTAIAKAKINLPANIEAEMQAEIAALQKRISAPSGDRITVTQGKTIKLANGLEVDEVECVIVEFVAANYYYDKQFDRSNIVPPKCFAIGMEPAGLIPSGNSPDKQCEACTGCWANQFKSAANGRGKACSNTRLLALLPLDADQDTPIQILKVSSTATRYFDSHVANVASKYGKPVRGVTTKITLSDEEYPSLRFEVIEALSVKDPLLAVAYANKESSLQRLLTEPDVSASTAANDSRRPAAKKVARR
jgi:hypothetical protein